MSVELVHNFSTYLSLINHSGVAEDVITADDYQRFLPKLEALWEHMNKEYSIEIEVGQLTVEGLANFTAGAIAIGQEGAKLLTSLYDAPIQTNEDAYAEHPDAQMLSHLVQNGLCSILVVKSPVSERDDLMVGISGTGQVTLSVINFVEGN